MSKRAVAESALGIRDDACRLVHILELEDWESAEEHASNIKDAIHRIQESFQLFDQLKPFSEVDDYEARLSILRLDNTIKENLRIFEKEWHWLDRPTKRVLENAKGDLSIAAEAIFMGCVHVAEDLGLKRKLPEL